jgi:hypothetical protein
VKKCAVKRRWTSAGATPAREISVHAQLNPIFMSMGCHRQFWGQPADRLGAETDFLRCSFDFLGSKNMSNRLFMGCEEHFVEYQMNELLVGRATGFPPDTSLHNRHSLHGLIRHLETATCRASGKTFAGRDLSGPKKLLSRKEEIIECDVRARFRGSLFRSTFRSTLPRITHGNHPRSVRLARPFQCLAVPQQPLKLLETLES